MTDDKPALPPEVIERLRTIGLRLDRGGRMWHQGDEITHAGLRHAILRWLDVLPDGRPIVRLDAERFAYIDVDDTPLRIVSTRWDGDVPHVLADDGSDTPLDLASLTVDADDRMRCKLRDGRLDARFTTIAQHTLLERADEKNRQLGLVACGRFWPLAPVTDGGAGTGT